MRVRRDVRDAITFLNAHALKRRGPAIASLEELPVVLAQAAVHDGLTLGVKRSRTAGKLQRAETDFHGYLISVLARAATPETATTPKLVEAFDTSDLLIGQAKLAESAV